MWQRTVSVKSRTVLVALLFGWFGSRVEASPLPTPTELMTKIDSAQKDLHSLRADFVQNSRVKLFRQQISSEGRFLYAKGNPARLRWEYLKQIGRASCRERV